MVVSESKVEAEAGKSAGRDPESVMAVVNSHRAAIEYCYQRALRKNPNLKGKISLKFIITPTGSIKDVIILSNTLNDPSVEKCIIAKIKSLSLQISGYLPRIVLCQDHDRGNHHVQDHKHGNMYFQQYSPQAFEIRLLQASDIHKELTDQAHHTQADEAEISIAGYPRDEWDHRAQEPDEPKGRCAMGFQNGIEDQGQQKGQKEKACYETCQEPLDKTFHRAAS